MLPEVDKALKKGKKFKLGPQAIGVVDKLRKAKLDAEESERKIQARLDQVIKHRDELLDEKEKMGNDFAKEVVKLK